MEFLNEIAEEAGPLKLSTSDLIKRIKRRRRVRTAAAACGVMVLALGVTTVIQQQGSMRNEVPTAAARQPQYSATSSDMRSGGQQPATAELDAKSACGQDVRRLPAMPQSDTSVRATVAQDVAQPVVAIAQNGGSPTPQTVSMLVIEDGKVVSWTEPTPLRADGITELAPSRHCTAKGLTAFSSGTSRYEVVVLGTSATGTHILKWHRFSTPDNSFQVYTHCGIRGFMYAGRWWAADPGTPEAKWGDPFEYGSLRKTGPDVLEFTGTSGGKVVFRRTGHTENQAPPCD